VFFIDSSQIRTVGSINLIASSHFLLFFTVLRLCFVPDSHLGQSDTPHNTHSKHTNWKQIGYKALLRGKLSIVRPVRVNRVVGVNFIRKESSAR
jgi:hypothetical protein